MRVLLIQPEFNKRMLNVGRVEPLALEILASTIEKEHDVEILELQYDKNLYKKLRNFSPDIVGISAISVQALLAKNIARKVKIFNKNIITIIGGNHASMLPEYFNKPFINCIVLNHGFETFPDLVNSISNKKNIKNVPGLIVIEDGKLIKTPDRFIKTIDSLPFPNRNLTKKYRKKYHMFHMAPEALITTSIGCPYRCNFCSCWKYTQGNYFTRSPENIVKEMKTIKEKNIFFADDNTFHDVIRADKLADLIKKSGLRKSFTAYARADKIVKHPELFLKWKKIGLNRMIVGIEGIENEDLKNLNKCSSRDINIQAIGILNKIGVLNFAHFIITQDFTPKKFEKLKKYIYKNKLFFPAFPILTPLPGSDIWEKKRKDLIAEEYDLFDLSHTLLPTKIPLEKFLKSIEGLYSYNFSVIRFIKFRLECLFGECNSVKAKEIAPFHLWLWMKIGSFFAMKKMIKNHKNLLIKLNSEKWT